MPMRYYPYRKKAAKAVKRTFHKKKVYPKKAIAKTVNAVVKRMAEKKRATVQVNSSLTAYSNALSSGLILPMTPYTTNGMTIAQGTGQGDRIGNRIRPTKLTVRWVAYPLPYNATFNPNPVPMNLMIWWFKPKVNPTVLPTSLNSFFQLGDSSQAPTSTLFDLTYMMNNDSYTFVKRKTFKLGYALNAGTGNQAGSQSLANNDYKLNVIGKVDLTKHCPKVIKYNDSTNNPTSPLLLMYSEVVPADGSTWGNSIIPATIFTEVDIWYTDD